jgi:hypothetical protein
MLACILVAHLHICTFIGQVFVCNYIFMAMYNFIPPFHETKFGVLSRVFVKLVCAAGEESLWSTAVV